MIQCFNARTHSATILNSNLPVSSRLLRSTLHFLDVYLLGCDGNLMNVYVSEKEGELKFENKLTRT